MRKAALILSIASCLLISIPELAQSEDTPRFKADTAVANILWDYDNSEQFATWKVNRKGFVDIIFANNIPSELYVEILNKLRKHPDIDGVLAGKGGPSCSPTAWKY